MPLAATSIRGARLNWRLAVNGIHHASRLLVPRSRAVSATLPLRFPAADGKQFAARAQARGRSGAQTRALIVVDTVDGQEACLKLEATATSDEPTAFAFDARRTWGSG